MLLILRDPGLRKKIMNISFPAMGEMVLYMLIGVVDTAVVGRLGAAPLAAISLGAELFFAVILFVSSLGIGASVMVAQAKGAGRLEYAAQVAGKAFLVALIAGLITGYLGVAHSSDLIYLFNIEHSVRIQALSYLNIVFWISPIAIVYMITNGIFRGLGRTDLPMKIALVTNIINCVGDYVLVYGVWGFPELGVAGAAWATSTAHAAGFILSVYVLFSGRSGLKVSIQHLFSSSTNTVKKMFTLGIPAMIEDFCRRSADILFLFIMVYVGTIAFASHEIAIVVESISFMPGFGIAMAATALVGHAVGAKDQEEVLRASRGCLEFAVLFMGFIGLFFALFPYFIASLFTNEPELIELSGLLIRIAALEQVTIAATMVLDGIIRGSGDTRTPMYIMTFFTWFYRVPLVYCFVFIWNLSVVHIWGLFVVDWAFRTLVFSIIYHRRRWLRKAIDQTLLP